MMLVKILEFGSNWWARFDPDDTDPWRFSCRAAYYNSAGLRCGQKIRRHWTIPGLIRFNGIGAFDPHFPSRAIGATFCCESSVLASRGNRLFLAKKASISDTPDYFLAVISSDRHGLVDFRNPAYKSESAVPISVSELRNRQEVLILMRPGAWVRTSIGLWKLVIQPDTLNGASLQLAEL